MKTTYSVPPLHLAGLALRDALLRAQDVLEDAGVETPGRDARKLMGHTLGVGADRVALMGNDILDADAAERFAVMITKRAQRMPVSHITGLREFWGRTFHVTPAVLDPRPETEILVEHALTRPFTRVLDLGTGSGCIILSLLDDNDTATGVGVDISSDALEIARGNAAALGLDERVEWVLSDWLEDVHGGFDLVVSNPPYITETEMQDLAPEVRDYEPHGALTPGGDGLAPYAIIAGGIENVLAPGGWLMVEIGPEQGDAVSEIFMDAGLEDVEVLPDWDGRDRVVVARRTA